MELLEIKNLYKNYGEKQVLNNITLTVRRTDGGLMVKMELVKQP